MSFASDSEFIPSFSESEEFSSSFFALGSISFSVFDSDCNALYTSEFSFLQLRHLSIAGLSFSSNASKYFLWLKVEATSTFRREDEMLLYTGESSGCDFCRVNIFFFRMKK